MLHERIESLYTCSRWHQLYGFAHALIFFFKISFCLYFCLLVYHVLVLQAIYFFLFLLQVCKYFLEAVEKKQYGWFWVCPNGGKDCHYRHALPPGYVLKSQMKALIEEEADKIPIEEEIENQRAKITATTPMTPELFMQWKKKKVEEREAGLAAQRAERAKNDRMSGRELFLSDASLFVDDAEAYDKYRREEPDAEQKDDKGSSMDGPSSSTTNTRDIEDVADEDDDDLDMDELNELEASLSKTTLQIKEPGDL
ncbi:zinc finger CCCH domain-containing 11 [Olea europaea subsp. europaea]|uniref:Zinc finger CCCH domain-containing 11 n=1 Tax=Olea europaea subsp. europaea TaxID=158383 RepID=A0A8S0UN79_OLEEU|nr:zinc finger CCCH domain-containing 11 [Olea europaea subsp. europaea]